MNLQKTKPLDVLLIGREERLLWFLPSILSRAGFAIDILTSSNIMKSCHYVRDCEIIHETSSIISAAAKKCKHPYDWIIITEDRVLSEILHSNLPIKTKLKLLPVIKKENFSHIHTKIGLSKIFSREGISTPSYCVVATIDDAYVAAEQLGYPVLLKIDASGGGFGVYECGSLDDLKSIKADVWLKPLLMQKKIDGIALDLSALYLDGELIHFSYSKMEKVISNKFGPSSLRTYHALSSVDQKVFDELRKIGKVLGAHGFTNITCIEAFDGSGRYYIEVDMRPNVWVDASIFLGEDVAERISRWYSKRECLNYPVLASDIYPSAMQIPYFLRLNFFELLINRYNVWRFIPKDNWLLISMLFFNKIKEFLSRCTLKNLVKCLIPKRYHPRLKNIYFKIYQIGILKS